MVEINIFGIGGHARSVAYLLQASGYKIKGYFHPDGSAEEYLLQTIPWRGQQPGKELPLVLAVGDNEKRADLYEKFPGVLKTTVVHPTANVALPVKTDSANLIFPFAYLGPEVKLGYNNIINTRSTLEHEVAIGNHCHISIGALLAGRVTIGDHCFVGAGAIVKDKISICSGVTLGAGAVVIKNIKDPGVYVGNPLKRLY